ncbi:MAG: glycoside hydrolase family 2 protein [Oscillospiraceae bacterium]|nr:glycoside hydrolase family 2 protein [Oscillospiraceae bacterium]
MRTKELWNEGWSFSKDSGFADAEQVSLPHCFNSTDGQDGGNDYFRGTGYYRKEFTRPVLDGDEIWVEFRSVAMVSTVTLNGVELGRHTGGYSTFRFELTPHLQDNNVLVVTANNEYSETYYPQKADFTFYGGIYRDVWLLGVPKEHFQLDHFGGEGFKVTPVVSKDLSSCEVKMEAWISSGTVTFSLQGEEKTAEVRDGKAETSFVIPNPHLWNGKKDPFLYEATAVSSSGDEVSTRFGCRRYEIDPERGFILNNKEYRLAGVSKHQDRWAKGNAVSKEDLKEDMDIVLELGVNTLRLAHYQHDQYFYDLCDEKGIIVWAEIPYITAHMKDGRENTLSQMQELIVQNYNHPSIIVWGLSNEITTQGGVTKDLEENHKLLNVLAHKLDPTRLTTMAHVFILKTKEPIARLTDVSAWNLYYGWYVGDLPQNEKFLDKYHKKYPKAPIGLSEYGADANIQYQTAEPIKGDYTEAYQCLYHEHILEMWSKRPYLWTIYAWNLFDFGADARNEGGKKGQNQKGLVTIDRKTRKDAFYIYKAYFSDEPFVHLCGKRYEKRVEAETELKVYSNQKEVTLYVDGKPVETQKGERIFRFNFELAGSHEIEVRSGELADSMTVQKVEEKPAEYQSETMMVHNWFDVEVKKGYFSLKDAPIRIKRSKEGKAVLDKYYYPMIHGMTERYGDVSSGVKIPKITYTILDFVPLEKLFRMLGSMISLETVEGLGKELPKIRK